MPVPCILFNRLIYPVVIVVLRLRAAGVEPTIPQPPHRDYSSYFRTEQKKEFNMMLIHLFRTCTISFQLCFFCCCSDDPRWRMSESRPGLQL